MSDEEGGSERYHPPDEGHFIPVPRRPLSNDQDADDEENDILMNALSFGKNPTRRVIYDKWRRAALEGVAKKFVAPLCILVAIILLLFFSGATLSAVSLITRDVSDVRDTIESIPWISSLGDLILNPSPLMQCYFTCRGPPNLLEDDQCRQLCGCCLYLDICLFQAEGDSRVEQVDSCLDRAWSCDLVPAGCNVTMDGYCSQMNYVLL